MNSFINWKIKIIGSFINPFIFERLMGSKKLRNTNGQNNIQTPLMKIRFNCLISIQRKYQIYQFFFHASYFLPFHFLNFIIIIINLLCFLLQIQSYIEKKKSTHATHHWLDLKFSFLAVVLKINYLIYLCHKLSLSANHIIINCHFVDKRVANLLLSPP